MIFARTAADAAPSRFARRTPEGAAIWRTDFFGPPPSPVDSGSVDPGSAGGPEFVEPKPGEIRPPQAFLVEQEPGATVHAHFHYVDQFQVVVGGSGRIGKHLLTPIMVHFAGANTPYGPILPSDQGLSYFTLRASADTTGAQFMPAARARRRPAPWRYELAPPVTSTEEALSGRQKVEIEQVLSGDGGLTVLMFRLPPGGSVNTPPPSAGSGQSLLVTAGSIFHGGSVCGRLSALFIPPDSPTLELTAGTGGADVLLLQFPKAGG